MTLKGNKTYLYNGFKSSIFQLLNWCMSVENCDGYCLLHIYKWINLLSNLGISVFLLFTNDEYLGFLYFPVNQVYIKYSFTHIISFYKNYVFNLLELFIDGGLVSDCWRLCSIITPIFNFMAQLLVRQVILCRKNNLHCSWLDIISHASKHICFLYPPYLPRMIYIFQYLTEASNLLWRVSKLSLKIIM